MSFENFKTEDNKLVRAMDLRNEKKNKNMHRILKFRAWDEREKKMIYDLTLEFINSELRMATPNHNWIVGNIMQYTGLKDKKGKEIYEGDIVKMFDEDNRDNICEVLFNNGGFIVEWDGNFAGGEADLTTVGWAIEEGIEIEVIGNIYQNPNLLK